MGARIQARELSQEGLKLLACVTMLLDHNGAALVPAVGLRVIGRLAFPIYCFLLAEGVRHTRDVKRYLLRLFLGALISELPFDLLFFGGWTWAAQSVMVTLFLSCAMAALMARAEQYWIRLLLIIPFALLAQMLRTDYGAWGVLMIAVFVLTREPLLQGLCIVLIGYAMGGMTVGAGALETPIQVFACLAMIPICMYSGRKVSSKGGIRWAFYLFYPAHLLALWWIR